MSRRATDRSGSRRGADARGGGPPRAPALSRGAAAALILAAWGASLGWLARRQYASYTDPNIETATERLPPGAAFYAVRLDGHQVGVASVTIDTLVDGIRLTDRLDLELPAGAERRRVLQWSDAVLSDDLRLRSLSSRQSGTAETIFFNGRVEGDSAITLELNRTAESDRGSMRLPLDGPVVVPAAVPLRAMYSGNLRVGDSIKVPVFDPVSLQERTVRVRVAAESVFVVADSATFDSVAGLWIAAHFDTLHAWRLDHLAGPLPTRIWTDGQGYVIRARTAEGFTLERSAFEIVNNNYRNQPTTDSAPLRLPAGMLRRPPPRRARFVVQVDTTGWPELAEALDGGRQRWQGDTLVVEREAPGKAGPLDADYRLPARDSALEPYLAAEPLIPARDPVIGAHARRVLDGERDPSDAAGRLARWVADQIALATADTSLDPRGALEGRRGTAESLALLYVAMARSVGLPARVVSGIVYSRGGWRYHTWAEVYLGDWVAVDPTFGRFPADASNVRLVSGRLGRPAVLAPMASRIMAGHR